VSLFSRYLRDAADEVLMGLAYLILILKALPLIIILAVPDGRIMDYMSQERKEYE
jgi:ABC-type dipeptide/oligopeptide/nickel transport system permease subunit